MLLSKLKLADFGCHPTLEIDGLDRLVVLVGENDAGKSLVLRAISDLIRPTRYDSQIPRCDGDAEVDTYTISGEFLIEATDAIPDEYRLGCGSDRMFVRKEFGPHGVKTHIRARTPEDDGLAKFESLSRNDQFAVLQRFEVKPEGQQEQRVKQLQEILLRPSIRFIDAEREVTDREVELLLPRIESVSAGDYRAAQALLTRALRNVVREVIYDDINSPEPIERAEIRHLREELEQLLNERLQEVSEYVQSHQPQVDRLLATPVLQFDGALSRVEIQLEVDGIPRPLAGFGDGTNKRVWMGVLQWEEALDQSPQPKSLIRTYDEPDTSLHYAAQHQLLRGIQARAVPSKKTQCFVATHSLALIDRVPASTIRLLQIPPTGPRSVRALRGHADADVAEVFRDIGRAIGLSNSALLYERAFLIVEGESEEAAIPILYRNLYQTSLIDDGIVLVNLYGCGAWRSALEMVLRNRHDICHLLLDEDSRQPGSSANVSPAVIQQLGLPADFITNHITFIGATEYEDAFADDVICLALDSEFPREDGTPWMSNHLAIARSSDKFSEALRKVVIGSAEPRTRNRVSKPSLADAVARTCGPNEVPQQVTSALQAIRVVAGVEDEVV